MLTPVDLETTVFHRSFRGYNKNEVQDLMERIIRDYEHLYRENIDLKERIEGLNVRMNQYTLIEETLRNTMVMAQETAEEVKRTAHEEAELIVKEAQIQGEQIKMRIKEEIQIELRNLALLKNQAEYFKCQFKSFLGGLLDLAEKQLDLPIEWDKYAKPAVNSAGEAALSKETETNSSAEAASNKVPF
jgi:cell division initiation protein